MDPLSTATAFATIVSLLGNFSAERRSTASASFEEFMEWATKNNHQEVLDRIGQNSTTILSIKALLNEGHDEFATRLQRLDASLAQLATGFNGFRELALAVYPGTELSDQALSIVEQFVDSGASKVLVSHYIDGATVLHMVMGGSGQISYNEPRLMEDDLNTLVQFGLLRMEYNSKGDPLYLITRNAIKFVQARRNDVT